MTISQFFMNVCQTFFFGVKCFWGLILDRPWPLSLLSLFLTLAKKNIFWYFCCLGLQILRVVVYWAQKVQQRRNASLDQSLWLYFTWNILKPGFNPVRPSWLLVYTNANCWRKYYIDINLCVRNMVLTYQKR